MSNDSNSPVMSDLEWLAREVDEWNDNADVVFRLDGRAGWVYDIGRFAPRGDEYTRAQWAAERQRLQNKPSWDDAPEWAEWLAQDADGSWCFFPKNSALQARGDMWGHDSISSGIWASAASTGQVLGDWQDTLERRPADNTKPVVSQGENNMNDVPLDTVKWNGEGLPPVGCICDCQMGSHWYEVEVIGATREAVWVKAAERGDYWTVMNGISLRSRRTPEEVEREELFNLIHQNSSHGDAGAVALADALYDAGYRKQGDKS